MKNLTLILLIIFVWSCDKDELPEETQEGKGTFGMLINDEIWLPYIPVAVPLEGQALNIYYSKNSGTLFINAKNTKRKEELFFFIEGIKSIGNYNFSFRNNSKLEDSIFYCVDSTRFQNDKGCTMSFKLIDSTSSNINISKLDTINRIVSGTFYIELYDILGNKLNITNGRFDANY